MKNGLLIWNIILTLGIGYLLFAQLSGKKTVDNKVITKAETAKTPFRIAYFVMDSIESNFEMVKDVKREISKKDEEYGNDLSRLDWQYRKKQEEIQQKAQAGMTPDQQKAELAGLQQLENKLRNDKQAIDNGYQDFVMRKNLSVKKEIEDFLAAYNQAHNYSYIVSYEQGLFYYKDTVYNITDDLIRGLNDIYKKKKK